MKILLDLDGVLCDFVAGAMRLHNKPWPYDDPANLGPQGWDIFKMWGMSAAEFWTGMEYEFWRNLDPYPWAEELVQGVQELVGVENVAFCTSPAHQPGCIEGKIDWCKYYFPHVPVIITRAVKGQPAPKHFLAHEGVILIDDYDKNVDTFKAHGGQALLFPQPWNRLWRFWVQADRVETILRSVKFALNAVCV